MADESEGSGQKAPSASSADADATWSAAAAAVMGAPGLFTGLWGIMRPATVEQLEEATAEHVKAIRAWADATEALGRVFIDSARPGEGRDLRGGGVFRPRAGLPARAPVAVPDHRRGRGGRRGHQGTPVHRGVAVKLTAAEELAIGDRILELEAVVREVVSAIPACVEVLRARRKGHEGRTRAANVQRLEDALALAEALGAVDRDAVQRARAAWSEAVDLRWRLALSATRIALREANKLRANGILDLADLEQEALIGLLDAAIRFDATRGWRFATYAKWWARARMTRAIDMARPVKLSAGAAEQLRNLRKVLVQREALGLPAPTVAALAEALGVEADRVRMLLGANSIAMAAIDRRDEEDGPRHDEAPQLEDGGPTPHDEAVHAQEARLVRAAVQTLPRRHRYIIERRYGLGGPARTLTEIGRVLQLSRERIRQLEREALELIRDACSRPRVALST